MAPSISYPRPALPPHSRRDPCSHRPSCGHEDQGQSRQGKAWRCSQGPFEFPSPRPERPSHQAKPVQVNIEEDDIVKAAKEQVTALEAEVREEPPQRGAGKNVQLVFAPSSLPHSFSGQEVQSIRQTEEDDRAPKGSHRPRQRRAPGPLQGEAFSVRRRTPTHWGSGPSEDQPGPAVQSPANPVHPLKGVPEGSPVAPQAPKDGGIPSLRPFIITGAEDREVRRPQARA